MQEGIAKQLLIDLNPIVRDRRDYVPDGEYGYLVDKVTKWGWDQTLLYCLSARSMYKTLVLQYEDFDMDYTDIFEEEDDIIIGDEKVLRTDV